MSKDTTNQSIYNQELREKIEEIIGNVGNYWYETAKELNHDQDSMTETEATKLIIDLIEQEKIKAKIEILNRLLSKTKYIFQPVGGISNIEYIAVHDIKSELAQLKELEK